YYVYSDTTDNYTLSLHDALPICMAVIVPNMCLPLLREQRTHYTQGREAEQYSAELERTFDQIKSAVKTPPRRVLDIGCGMAGIEDRKSTRLNSSHVKIPYAVFCL